MRWIRKDCITETGARFILPIVLVLGIYIILHGHLSPGGGFQGGVILAGGIAIYYIGKSKDSLFKSEKKINRFKMVESLAALIYLILGVLGLIVGKEFFANVLSKGGLGQLFSSGTIFAMNFAVGGKVLFGVGFLILILLKYINSEDGEVH